MSTENLLKKILEMANKNDIEINKVNIDGFTVTVNSKVYVNITSDGYYHVHKSSNSMSTLHEVEMLDEVLEALLPNFKKGDTVTNGKDTGVVVQAYAHNYHIVNMINHKTFHELPTTLKQLDFNGWYKKED